VNFMLFCAAKLQNSRFKNHIFSRHAVVTENEQFLVIRNSGCLIIGLYFILFKNICDYCVGTSVYQSVFVSVRHDLALC